MVFLAIAGAVVITIALIVVTIYYGGSYIMSDETVWFGLKNYPVQMIIWLLLGLVIMVSWGSWIYFLASHLSLSWS